MKPNNLSGKLSNIANLSSKVLEFETIFKIYKYHEKRFRNLDFQLQYVKYHN